MMKKEERLLVLGSGEMLGEEGLNNPDYQYSYSLRVIDKAVLFRIPKTKL